MRQVFAFFFHHSALTLVSGKCTNLFFPDGITEMTFAEGEGTANVDDGAKMLIEYDHQWDQWVPLCSPCRAPIPKFPTSDVKAWAQKRLDLVEVDRSVDRNGMMAGPPCIPQGVANCTKCGSSMRDAFMVEQRPFTLRTYRGAVLRRVFDVQCAKCHNKRSWDPYFECILTINEGREGGKRLAKLLNFSMLHATSDDWNMHDVDVPTSL